MNVSVPESRQPARDPLISVIVPAWNNAGQVGLCIQALLDQSLPREDYEIIIIDNGSRDDTRKVAESYASVKVLSEERPGSYVARNTAARTARGRYFAFTDSDCIPDPRWLEAARKEFDAGDFGVLVGPIKLFDEDGPGKGSSVYRNYEALFAFPQDVERGNCATANWLCPASVFRDLGGFKEDLRSGADKDMTLRIRAAGHRLKFVPGMVVNHPVRATLGALANKRRRLTGGRWMKLDGRFRLPRALKSAITEAAHRLLKVARATRHPMPERLQIAGLLLAMSLLSCAEYVRLACGGKAVR